MVPRLLRVKRFGDERGWFSETYSARRLAAAGIADDFVQDNHAFSADAGVLRGLHYQAPPHAQAKLVRCIAGAIWDVAVDVRRGSPSFGRWVAATLTASGGEQLYVPVGFAHGYLTLTASSEVVYKTSAYYAPETEGAVRWDDPTVALPWPLDGRTPQLSAKDVAAPPLNEAESPFDYAGEPLGDLQEIDA